MTVLQPASWLDVIFMEDFLEYALADFDRQLAALDAQLLAARTAWRWAPADHARLDALVAAARTVAAAQPGLELLAAGWHADPEKPAPTIPAAQLDFAAKTGQTLAFSLKPDADNPRDVALFSNVNHLGSPADSAYGKGREIRLIDGEIEVTFSDRLPVYALILRTEGAAIRPGEWRHVAVSYTGGKSAAKRRIAEQHRHHAYSGPGERLTVAVHKGVKRGVVRLDGPAVHAQREQHALQALPAQRSFNVLRLDG
jgi:hypothetical protein